MDRTTIEAVERGAPVGLPHDAEAVLIVEIEGLKEHTDRALEIARVDLPTEHAARSNSRRMKSSVSLLEGS
jgi:hypothetical protein